MKSCFRVGILLTIMFFALGVWAQVPENKEKLQKEKTSTIPKVIDFSKIFEQQKMTREDFEALKREKETELQARLSQPAALEKSVNPEKYIVGPGDIFSFNVRGPTETQVPITVSPEGKLNVPSVGEIGVDGKTLSEVQTLVLKKAAPVYGNSKIALALEAVRFFRVHVVGEVKYPGTYITQAINRISELITDAGGATDWAWKRKIELRHPDGSVDYFDLTSFEQKGDLKEDLFVNGGDVIYIPPIELSKSMVKVEGDLANSGIYQIFQGEKLLDFLQRIRTLKRNTNLSKIVVIRSTEEILPFQDEKSMNPDFPLQNGDRVVIPSNYVYVKGTVRIPGAYPYVLNLTARDYAGMAGGDYRSGSIKSVRVYHVRTGKIEKGPNVIVEPGDVVHLNPSWNERFRSYIQILPAITSLILAAKAAGLFGK